MSSSLRMAAAGAVVSLALAACSSPTAPAGETSMTSTTASGSSSSHDDARGSTSSTASAAPSSAAAVLAHMSLRQKIGQLLMVDCPSTGVAAATSAAIRHQHVGAVILDGTTSEGMTAVRSVTSRLQRLAPKGLRLFVATDQEGGEVQRLQGSGFSTIPSGVEQGRLSTATLRRDARTWGRQLARAGVDVDLAPVMDTVPAHFGSNPPIGNLDREYGRTPSTVASHGVAFLQGLAAAHVDATAKHFPGLGRVRGNTDTTAGVTDDVTTASSSYLTPYLAAVRAGVPFVMMSTAIYRKLDPGVPAAFSSSIVTGLLRKRDGFRGVVISDDLGNAAQVSHYPVGQRAVDFVRAGGDMVLTVVASDAAPMADALVAEARRSPAFARQVDAAALTVLEAKQAAGLLG